MNNHVLLEQVRRRFDENHLPYGMLDAGNGARIVVSQRGGRILGPFWGEQGESVLWASGAFANASGFRRFLDASDWNIGGDRVWIAPEHRFNVKDRFDFNNSYVVPAQLDPGRYTLETVGGGCRLKAEIALDVHGPAAAAKKITIERFIVPAADPLRELDGYRDLTTGVAYAGFLHEAHLSEVTSDGTSAEIWNLAQVNPGGHAYVSVLGGGSYTDFYEPAGPRHEAFPAYTRITIDAQRMFKVGYKAARVLGRLAYHNSLDGGGEYLFVRAFFCNPSGTYTMEPSATPGDRGYPVQIFNDDGTYGGFGEIECSGLAIGGESGGSRSADLICSWFYAGSRESLGKIARVLMGVDLR